MLLQCKCRNKNMLTARLWRTLLKSESQSSRKKRGSTNREQATINCLINSTNPRTSSCRWKTARLCSNQTWFAITTLIRTWSILKPLKTFRCICKTLCLSSSQTLWSITSRSGMNRCCQSTTRAKNRGCLRVKDLNNWVLWSTTHWRRRMCSHSPTTIGHLQTVTTTSTWNHWTLLRAHPQNRQIRSKPCTHASSFQGTSPAKRLSSRYRLRSCPTTAK